MELSLQVKGYLMEKIAEIFSWSKMATLAARVGVDPSKIQTYSDKRRAAQYIISNLPKDREEQSIKVVLEMSQRGTWDSDYRNYVFDGLQPIVQDTMGYRLESDGSLIPIFDKSFNLEEQQNFILTKLNDFGFDVPKRHYQDALRSFSASPKGAIGLLRSSFEALVTDILTSKGITPTGNMKDDLQKLETIGILKEIDRVSCTSPFFGMFSEFRKQLELTTKWIIVGHSFRDEAIKNIFLDAPNRNKKIVLLDKNAERIVNESLHSISNAVKPIEGEFESKEAMESMIEFLKEGEVLVE